jgi:23S rRNA-/tRNA-specific pseudouridylate synthase
VEPEAGTWEDYLRKIPEQPRAEVVPARHPEGRLAVLHYRTLGVSDWGTWLEIELETGRMHQIRIQASSRGYPLFGDSQYGSQIPFGPQSDDLRQRPIALHARCLAFRHPMTHEPIDITAPLPAAWKDLEICRSGDLEI